MQEYTASINILAPPEAVWRILTDVGGYANWNPEILAIEGRLGSKARIRARVKLGDGAIRMVPMRVITFDPPRKMQWKGGLPLGLFTGLRTFTVAANEGPALGATRFTLRHRMSGPLAPLILKSVGNRQPEIDAFAAALKARAERG